MVQRVGQMKREYSLGSVGSVAHVLEKRPDGGSASGEPVVVGRGLVAGPPRGDGSGELLRAASLGQGRRESATRRSAEAIDAKTGGTVY
jgi:hypothetical protein